MRYFFEKIKDFFADKFINLQNIFYHRYDRVKVPQVKPWEYCDKTGLLLYADMKILVDFIQKQKPQAYVMWYTEFGHKLGQDSKLNIYVQQYRGKWVMDIMMQIYEFWKVGYGQRMKQIEYVSEILYHYVIGKMSISQSSYQVLFDNTKLPKTIEEIKEEVDWQILDKYLQGDRENLFNEQFVRNKIIQAQNQLQNDCQKYLHLLIDVRPYLWT